MCFLNAFTKVNEGKLHRACFNKNKIEVLNCVCAEFWIPNIDVTNLISDFQISGGSWILSRRDARFYCIKLYEDISLFVQYNLIYLPS